jgi:MFS family permease
VGTETTIHSKMPPGVGNAFAFQVFNTISFSIVLGTPMILFFKGLGASATVLGIVAALPPLLTVLQIPAAQFVEQVGYRAFVLRGWTIRSVFILGMAIVAALPDRIGITTRIALMLFLLFVFNTSRGISLCGFLPWITQLIPESVRGRFISRDQMSSALAMLGTMMFTAFFLSKAREKIGFEGVFLASFVAAVVSLVFLRRIPDVPVAQKPHESGGVPWKEMLRHAPFLKLLVYNVAVASAMAAAGVFWVPLLRDYCRATDGQILGVAALWCAVAAVSLWLSGRVIDRVGSRPLLALAGICLVLHYASWGSLAAGILPFNIWSILWIQSTAGVGVSVFNMANTRLAMATVPETGRSHFFALFSVVNSLTLGFVPIAWGVLLDSLQGWRVSWAGWEWNQYTILYAALVATIMTAQFLLHRLSEPRAMTTEEFFRELLVKTPARALSRLLARRPFS